ncbi:MAG: ABC transporter permease [Verrucomicrobiales bacterium]|nr:ABC transporter permease [Verrucomicrobiales bacterium]
MNLAGSFYLGLAYLRRQRAKTLLLTGALTVALLLPVAITVLVGEAETHLRSRAAGTPLLLGARGSALELVFNGLYFTKPEIATRPRQETDAAGRDGLATVIPVYARFSAQGHRIVGTTLDYFRLRGLDLREGRPFARLGDCVVGHAVAEAAGIRPGDAVVSSPEAVFDLAGVYPLKMRVTGVLSPTGTPDDRAIFADVKTTWIIEGLAHGHDDARQVDESQVLGQEPDGGNVKLNASVVEYNEVTESNLANFHFHGDPGAFPITAAIVVPRDEKSRTILLGRYQDADRLGVQLVEPGAVMDDLFDTVFQVQRLVVAALVLVGVAALAMALLVFLLSNRLRAREFSSLRQIGADPGTIRLLVAFEGVFVLSASAVAAALLAVVLKGAAPVLVRLLTG